SAGQFDRLNRDLGGRVPPAQHLQLHIIPGPCGTGPHYFLFNGRDPPLRIPQPVADVPSVPQVDRLVPSAFHHHGVASHDVIKVDGAVQRGVQEDETAGPAPPRNRDAFRHRGGHIAFAFQHDDTLAAVPARVQDLEQDAAEPLPAARQRAQIVVDPLAKPPGAVIVDVPLRDDSGKIHQRAGNRSRYLAPRVPCPGNPPGPPRLAGCAAWASVRRSQRTSPHTIGRTPAARRNRESVTISRRYSSMSYRNPDGPRTSSWPRWR